MVKKNIDSVVKIDTNLLDEIDEFIKKKENRFKFVNKKQFVDVAVNEFLEKMKREENKK
jgi:hypothetical protein